MKDSSGMTRTTTANLVALSSAQLAMNTMNAILARMDISYHLIYQLVYQYSSTVHYFQINIQLTLILLQMQMEFHTITVLIVFQQLTLILT